MTSWAEIKGGESQGAVGQTVMCLDTEMRPEYRKIYTRVFDPTIVIGDEHKEIHRNYKKLIDTLLESFCKDAKMTVEEATKGISKMSQVPDLREVFNVLFEQVLAATDFNIFCQAMTKRNIMIQEQVLVMIIAATGVLPESLTAGGKKQAAPQMKGTDDKHEDDLLRQVMKQSLAEKERDESRKQKEDREMKKTLELSQKEAEALEVERRAIEAGMKKLVLQSAPLPGLKETSPEVIPQTSPGAGVPPPAVYASKPKDKPTKSVSEAPGVVSAAPGLAPIKASRSSSEAANEWLTSARDEVAMGQTHSAMAASLAKLSPEELKQRQKFLQEQRDKLLAMKKEARAKQLGEATKAQPQRPQSARAARSAMTQPMESSRNEEDAKKLAMRRAIAEKLRQEVVGKP